MRYELLTTTPYGERTVRQIAYDPQGFVYNEEARSAVSLGGGHLMSRAPCYRVVCPNTGLLSEYIGINRVRFGAEFGNDLCVTFGGRAYVRQPLYAVIRRSRWPSEQEVLSDNIMAASEIKDTAPAATDLASLATTLQSAKPVAASAFCTGCRGSRRKGHRLARTWRMGTRPWARLGLGPVRGGCRCRCTGRWRGSSLLLWSASPGCGRRQLRRIRRAYVVDAYGVVRYV